MEDYKLRDYKPDEPELSTKPSRRITDLLPSITDTDNVETAIPSFLALWRNIKQLVNDVSITILCVTFIYLPIIVVFIFLGLYTYFFEIQPK
jgi:hypothetical protein